LRPSEVAEKANCHASTVKVVADELRMDLLRLSDGSRLFTESQAARIIAEIERRRLEALRK
jgi:hypothetical protein